MRDNRSLMESKIIAQAFKNLQLIKMKANSNVIVKYSWFVIGQCCNSHGINSTVEIA